MIKHLSNNPKSVGLHFAESCAAGCRPQSECQDTDRGLYVSVRYFHLLNLQLPSNLAAKKIRAITLSDETETAALQQEIAIIQKQTDVIVSPAPSLSCKT